MSKSVLLTVLVAAAIAAAPQENKPNPPAAASAAKPAGKELKRAELDRLLANPGKIFVLDLRGPDEIIQIGTLPGYVNIPLDQLESRLSEIPKDKIIVPVSNHSVRALKAQAILEKNGYRVPGGVGVQDYAKEGGKLIFPESISADAKSVIDVASKALGSGNLKTVEYSGSGSEFALGQAPNPSSPWPRFVDKRYTRTIDFETPASRIQRVRTQGENPPRGGGGQPIVGEQKQNVVITPGSPQAQTLRDELPWALPSSFLKSAAAASDATAKSVQVSGKKYTVLSFTAANKALVTGYLNDQNLFEKIDGKIDNNVLGDTPVETAFSEYKDFSGLKFPTHILQKQGGYPVLDLTITDVKANVSAHIEPPQGGGAAAGAIGPATSEKLGQEVYLIRGGYVAVAVGFKDYSVVIEGPQNDQRAKAIITEVKSAIPNKPIRYVVNTHAHFDHAGGLRAFVAEGATVITQQINEPYYEKIWANPHTLNPDELAKHPRAAQFKTVSEKLVLSDGQQVVELYHLQDFGHNDGALVAYLPNEKILVEADAFNPPAQPLTQTPAAVNPFTASLVDNIARLKLDVETIIPIHYPADNRKITAAELLIATGKPKLSAHTKAEQPNKTRSGHS